MAIAVDATSQLASVSAGTTATLSHTCTGANLVLTVLVTVQSGATPTVKYAGIPMTLRAQRVSNPAIYVYTLNDPCLGTNDIVVTKGSGVATTVGAVSLSGARDYASNANAGNTTGDPSCLVTTAQDAGYIVAGSWYTNPGTFSYNGGGTSFMAQDLGSNKVNCAYEAYSGGADKTETWDSSLGNNEWGVAAVEIYEYVADTNIDVENVKTGGDNSGTTITISMTVAASGASNRVLAVVTGGRDSPGISGITFGGVALTQRAAGDASQVWTLDDPTPGTANVVVTLTSGKAENVCILSLVNAETSDDTSTSSGFGTSDSITVQTNRTKGIAICGVGVNDAGTLTYTGGANEVMNRTQTDQFGGAAWRAYDNGDDVTETWTNANSRSWATSGVEIYQASSGIPNRQVILNQAVRRAAYY